MLLLAGCRPKVQINWDNLGFGLQDVAQVRNNAASILHLGMRVLCFQSEGPVVQLQLADRFGLGVKVSGHAGRPTELTAAV